MKYPTLIIMIFLICILPPCARSQGCSDAGVCTIHSIRPPDASDTVAQRKNSLSAGVTFGTSQHGVSVWTPYAEYTRTHSTRNYHRAPDVMLRISYTAVQAEKFTLVAGALPDRKSVV